TDNLAFDAFWAWGNGGGLYCRSAFPTIVNNTITKNVAAEDGGGIVCSRSSPNITNNTISDNEAGQTGGGIACIRESSPIISNNTVTDNSAGSGGGIHCDESSPSLSHNDFWNNTPDDYYGCGPGDGDISQDPMYVDPGGGDYHLSGGSQCVDVGDGSAPDLPYQDFDGDPRMCDGDGDAVAIVDIGADEYREEYEWNRAPAEWFMQGWDWFSIPLVPRWSADASDVLGFDCENRLFGWDDAEKTFLLYPDDFEDLAVGPNYVLL
ncbi:unnamed protein product, partial [marine sediment metagenome]